MHFLSSEFFPGDGASFASHDPCTGRSAWEGRAATAAECARAMEVARAAQPAWERAGFEARATVAERFAAEVRRREVDLAAAISRETGKPRWEARTEVASVAGKGAISIRAWRERAGESRGEAAGVGQGLRHRPHGVAVVLGPFNFPAHLPNGHIVPALLAGNAVVFKPREHTPGVGVVLAEMWRKAGLPPGMLAVAQGARPVAEELLAHPALGAVLFTGSAAGGVALHRRFAGRPEVMLALEMGGNNPLVVAGARDADAAALLVIQSAFLSAGQRCTCARRLIVVEDERSAAFLARLVERTRRIRVGAPDEEPAPFCGPVIHKVAAAGVLAAQEALLAAGAMPLVLVRRPDPARAFLTPGLLDVTGIATPDEEVFGPLLQVRRVPDFASALRAANDTRFGLAAGLVSDDAGLWEEFQRGTRAGIVNWNRPLTGASSAAPFGGIGLSGNHRPSAYYAADYCAWPVASLEIGSVLPPEAMPPGLDG